MPSTSSNRHFQRVAERIDVAPVLAQLDEHPELWDATPYRRIAPESPHTQMTDIWVRYNRLSRLREDPTSFNDEHVPNWYPAWSALPALRPIIFQLMTLFEGEMLGGVLITRIPPGGRIETHADTGWHVEYFDKFYLSLQSAPGARFWCELADAREWIEPHSGEVWLFDNRKPHSVVNESRLNRITLIACIRTEKFSR